MRFNSLLIDYYRPDKRKPAASLQYMEEAGSYPATTHESGYDEVEDRLWIESVMKRLRSSISETIAKVFYEIVVLGQTYEAVAKKYNLNLNTVKSHVQQM